jgi:hypothetical protein
MKCDFCDKDKCFWTELTTIKPKYNFPVYYTLFGRLPIPKVICYSCLDKEKKSTTLTF